jgi:peptidoglycan L-alanyl-D-glutamate endopeptidase CwlK
MPAFSEKSNARLATCDPRLQAVFDRVVAEFDCTILEGIRGMERQNELYRQGKSQLRFPESDHNKDPSRAVDAIAHPIDWKDRERQTLFAGYVLGVAAQLGVKLRWGGDWNRNFQVADNAFDDLVHFELMED